MIVAAMKINENVYWMTIRAFRRLTWRNTFSDDTFLRTWIALMREKNKAGRNPAKMPTSVAKAVKYRIREIESSSFTICCNSGARETNCIRRNKNKTKAKRSAIREII